MPEEKNRFDPLGQRDLEKEKEEIGFTGSVG